MPRQASSFRVVERVLGRTLLTLAIALLALMVAVGASMPSWARLVGGPEAHACHCEVRGGHAHCACPICFPELKDDDVLSRGMPSASGKCGQDDPGWRTLACAGVPTTSFVLAPALARVSRSFSPRHAATQWSAPPEIPPPRSVLSVEQLT